MTTELKHGDFSSLAEDYSRYREGYAPTARDALLGLTGRPPDTLDVVDVGAGTGIWTRILAEASPRSLVAVEPNPSMRERGIEDSRGAAVRWVEGSGESTGLPAASADVLTMASSFHWVDFDRGLDEFHRVLRPGGWFAALWNPRRIEANPLLVAIESEITRLKPDLSRITSSRSGLIATLTDRLSARSGFGDVVYIEGRHTVRQSVDHYLGIWRSANDVQVQLGPALFDQFMARTRELLAGHDHVDTTYLTTMWAARRE
ncbi:class I SAM-dependent methyltransferase [Amycolatopsis sp. NPDC021455]|uniref:class I SAM-dependent methyltransferase n=1 Tax=Amycolatopsis sp. NPDC021455 TaxID=3154901 RepID=UPI0033F62FAF